ncbi:MAG: hypothetical protein ACYCX2_04805 [Christensenellales bacterium]
MHDGREFYGDAKKKGKMNFMAVIKSGYAKLLQSGISKEGTFTLTDRRLELEGKSSAVSFLFGLLGSIFAPRKIQASIRLDRINSIARGKHGLNKNVLEITANGAENYRFIVPGYEYEEWEKAIKDAILALNS